MEITCPLNATFLGPHIGTDPNHFQWSHMPPHSKIARENLGEEPTYDITQTILLLGRNLHAIF